MASSTVDSPDLSRFAVLAMALLGVPLGSTCADSSDRPMTKPWSTQPAKARL